MGVPASRRHLSADPNSAVYAGPRYLCRGAPFAIGGQRHALASEAVADPRVKLSVRVAIFIVAEPQHAVARDIRSHALHNLGSVERLDPVLGDTLRPGARSV